MTHLPQLSKARTGIQGLDEVTGGGLPQGRPSLVCGGAGCGKTLLGMQFLVHGAVHLNEPGVFVAFEESAHELTKNFASLGFDLDDLSARRLLAIDSVQPREVAQSGDFDLEGLFIRLGYAIDQLGAKRVVLDTIETVFASMPSPATLRAELQRLFRWLKERGVTAVITGERGSDVNAMTRQGLEEYVSDCVIQLDHRVRGAVSSRRLRVVKYRGSTHGTNEYPFLIDEDGISVLPVTSLGLDHKVSTSRVPSGVPALDAMLNGGGYYRGSSVLVSGTAGTGKSSLAAHLAAETCRQGERVLYFAFEESAAQISRNMASIGIDLGHCAEQGLLRFHASRPTLAGLEMHLVTMLREVDKFRPHVVIVDPINSFVASSDEYDIKMMLLRLVDALKVNQVTGFFVSLTTSGGALEHTDVAISSLIDTWLLLRDIELGGERNRGLYVLKSRGMAHSNQIREFCLTDRGIELRPAYVGPAGTLTGSARLAQEASERAARLRMQKDILRRRGELQQKREAVEAQVRALRAEFATVEAQAESFIEEAQAAESQLQSDRVEMARSRAAEESP